MPVHDLDKQIVRIADDIARKHGISKSIPFTVVLYIDYQESRSAHSVITRTSLESAVRELLSQLSGGFASCGEIVRYHGKGKRLVFYKLPH